MRLRNDKNADLILSNNKKYYYDLNNNEDKTNWSNYLKNAKFIYLEIGMGKGNFIIENAKKYPHINYIGLEKNKVICAKAMKKILAVTEPLDNLIITNYDANFLTNIFPDNSIDKIFLNFSDPWPKKRHTKNRLTHPRFLNMYKQILKPDALIELKTDNDDFFKFTLESLVSAKVEIIYQTTDLHQNLNNEFNQNNIMTEYEQRFKELNKNINKVIFKFN